MIGLFKTEVIHRLGPWKSFEAVDYKTLEWVDCFSHQCPLELIGNIPPAEAEANYYAALEKLGMTPGKPSAVQKDQATDNRKPTLAASVASRIISNSEEPETPLRKALNFQN